MHPPSRPADRGPAAVRTADDPPLTRTHRPDGPLDVRLTLMMLRHGPRDPALRLGRDGTAWLARRTPDGPATLLLRPVAGEVAAAAWGPGAPRLLAGLPELLGARDDPRRFDPAGHATLASAHRHLHGLRFPRTGDVLGALVPAILEQRVVTADAHDAWRALLLRHGTVPPGPAPAGMRVAPDAATWREIPVWDWRRAGVDEQRTATLLRAVAVAGRLQEVADLPADGPRTDGPPAGEPPAGDLPADGLLAEELRRRLRTVRGIGPWTVAETTRRVLGDTDAVSVGDLHVPHLVGVLVAGRRVAQEELLDVLAPWAPHRARVVRLLELTTRSVGSPLAGPHPARPGHPVRTRPLPRRAPRVT